MDGRIGSRSAVAAYTHPAAGATQRRADAKEAEGRGQGAANTVITNNLNGPVSSGSWAVIFGMNIQAPDDAIGGCQPDTGPVVAGPVAHPTGCPFATQI
jgi:hypothetical protein